MYTKICVGNIVKSHYDIYTIETYSFICKDLTFIYIYIKAKYYTHLKEKHNREYHKNIVSRCVCLIDVMVTSAVDRPSIFVALVRGGRDV